MQDFGRLVADALAYYGSTGMEPVKGKWMATGCVCPLLAAYLEGTAGGEGDVEAVEAFAAEAYGLKRLGIDGFLDGYDGCPRQNLCTREYDEGYEAGRKAAEVLADGYAKNA